MPDVLVVGESLVDVLPEASGGTRRRAGGSPLNVAVGLGRLGVDVALVTALGPDADGDLVRAHASASHVHLLEHPVARTSVAVARLDDAGDASYDVDLRWELGRCEVGDAGWLHVGSLGVTQEPGARRVRALVEGRPDGCLVSYDPNCRPALQGPASGVLPGVEAMVGHSDLVKLSDQDAAYLLPDLDADALAARWLALGPAVVVLTRGAGGASAWTARGRTDVPAAPGGPVVDTVGAGDAFMAGLVLRSRGGLGRDLAATLRFAAVVARRTCERVGADPPRLDELLADDAPTPGPRGADRASG